jgi:hypothetical protein
MRIVVIGAVALFYASAVQADARTDILAVAQQYVADMSPATASLCTEDAVVIDGSAPYVWRGSHACDDWRKDQLAAAEKLGISNARLVLGEPLYVKVSGGFAYAAFPATLTYQKDLKSASLPGYTWTVAFRQVGPNWRIASWAFTDR